jgi:broad specificity phosphatase PhoE
MAGMGMLHLVRHGQARFASDDYDRLSELGQRQCHALGRWYAGHGQRFVAVFTGTLTRHRQSLAALAEGHGALPPAQEFAALNEYDSDALLRAARAAWADAGELPSPHTPEGYRAHFRLLKRALAAWTAGELHAPGLPRHADWRAGIASTLEHARARAAAGDGEVLVVSSGGPIATATAQVMGAPGDAWIELNLRLRNSALTEFNANPKRAVLHSFNTLPHLVAPEHAGWISYS